jgi:hypothetical protein
MWDDSEKNVLSENINTLVPEMLQARSAILIVSSLNPPSSPHPYRLPMHIQKMNCRKKFLEVAGGLSD